MTRPIHNQYIDTAHLYDYDDRKKLKDDLNFYRSYMQPHFSVLELCCGTGRLTIPLAEQVSKITGVDISAEMLGVFRAKTATLPAAIKRKIGIVHADISRFISNEFFDVIFIPYSSFQCLTNLADIDRCLKQIFASLKPGGRFILHTFKPYSAMDKSWETREEAAFVDIKNEAFCIKKTSVNKRINPSRRIIYSDLFYYYTEAGKKTIRIKESLKLKYYFENQLETLVGKYGFMIKEKYGYYDKTPISADSSELIYVCGKTG